MKKSPALAFLLACLLPGAGHWYVGQRGKAVVFCFVLIGLFALGTLLTNGYCVDFKPLGLLDLLGGDLEADVGLHPYAFLLQACMGAPGFLTLSLPKSGPQLPASKLNDLGMLLTLVAGALNALLIADALYRTGPPVKENARD